MFDSYHSYLEKVYTVFGQFSAWKLRAMTHQEIPWMATPRGQVIKVKLLTEYFSKALFNDHLLKNFNEFEILNKIDLNEESEQLRERKEIVPPPIPYINHLYGTGEIGEETRDAMIKERIDHELKFKMLQQFYLSTK
jgi:hypothetical protein